MRAQALVDPDRAAGGRALKQMEGEKEKREKGKGNGETARESAGQEGEEINQVGVGSTTLVGSTGSSRGCGRS